MKCIREMVLKCFLDWVYVLYRIIVEYIVRYYKGINFGYVDVKLVIDWYVNLYVIGRIWYLFFRFLKVY